MKSSFAASECDWMPNRRGGSSQSGGGGEEGGEDAAAAELAARQRSSFERNIKDAILWLRAPFNEEVASTVQKAQRSRPLINQTFVPGIGHHLSVTKEGRAAHQGCLPPEEAITLLQSLRAVMKQMLLGSVLQLVLLLTPYKKKHSHAPKADAWAYVRRRLLALKADERSLLEAHAGLDFNWLELRAAGVNSIADTTASTRRLQRDHLRAYDAIVIRELHRGCGIEAVAKDYGYADRHGGGAGVLGHLGDLQTMQKDAATYANQVRAFCEELGEGDMASLIGRFQELVEYGEDPDLKPLLSLPFVGLPRARAFYKAGLRSLAKLVESPVEDLVRALRTAPGAALEEAVLMKHAKRIHAEAQRKIKEEVDELQRMGGGVGGGGGGFFSKSNNGFCVSGASRLPFAIEQPHEDARAWQAFLDDWSRKTYFWAALPAASRVVEATEGEVAGAKEVKEEAPRVAGIAVCFNASRVYWLPLEQEEGNQADKPANDDGSSSVESVREAVSRMLGSDSRTTKSMCYNASQQVQLLASDGIQVNGVSSLIDVKLMAALIDPLHDATTTTLPALLLACRGKDATEAHRLANCGGSGCTGMERCCLQAVQSYAYVERIAASFQQAGHKEPLMRVLMPLVHAARQLCATAAPSPAGAPTLAFDASQCKAVLESERANCAELREQAEAIMRAASEARIAAAAEAEAAAKEAAIEQRAGLEGAEADDEAADPMLILAAASAMPIGAPAVPAEEESDAEWMAYQLEMALHKRANLQLGGSYVNVPYAMGQGWAAAHVQPLQPLAADAAKRAKPARKRQLLIATDVALARSAADGCDSAALLTRWRWCDVRVRALEAVMSLAEPSLDEMAHGDGEDAGRNADDAEEPTIWRLPLHLEPCARTARLQPVSNALSSFFRAASSSAEDNGWLDGSSDNGALRRCVLLPEDRKGVIVSVRLPLLPLRVLAHLSGDPAMVHAANASPSSDLLSHLAKEAAEDVGGVAADKELVWRQLLSGEAPPPTVTERDQSQRLPFFGDAGEEEGDACPTDAFAAAFPEVSSYHVELVRSVQSGRMALPTLSGRSCHIDSQMLRSESSTRERTAAAAALLPQVVGACADEVSSRLVSTLGRLKRQASGGQRWELIMHGRCELLFVEAEEAVGALAAAAAEAAVEVAREMELRVPVEVEVVRLEGGWR